MSPLAVKEVTNEKAVSAATHKTPAFEPDLPPPLATTVARGLADVVDEDPGLSPDLGLGDTGLEPERTPKDSLSPPPPPELEPSGEVSPKAQVPHQTLQVSRPLTVEEPTDGDCKITLTRSGGQWCLTVHQGWDVLNMRDRNQILERVIRVSWGQMDRLRRTMASLGKENVTLVDKV